MRGYRSVLGLSPLWHPTVVRDIQVDGDVKGRAVGSGLTTGYNFLNHGAFFLFYARFIFSKPDN
jgi:hypothetical protein